MGLGGEQPEGDQDLQITAPPYGLRVKPNPA
jgi:hypothetical protein